MSNQAKFGILIETQYQRAALGNAITDTSRLETELRKLKATTTGSAADNERLAQTYLQLNHSKQQVRDLTQQITHENGKLAQSITTVTDAVSQQVPALGQLSTVVQSIASAGGGVVGVGLAAAAVTAGLAMAAKSTASYALELRNMSETSGVAEKTLAALKLGAAETGRDFGTLQAGLFKFSRMLGEAVADKTSESAKKFKELKIDIFDASGAARSGEDVFRDMAEKIQHAGTEAEGARLAFDAFGKGGVGFALILKKGLADLEAQTKKMGTAMSPQAEQDALKFHEAQVKVEESTRGLTLALGGAAGGPMASFNERLAIGVQRMTAFVNIAKLLKIEPGGAGFGGIGVNTDRLMELMNKPGSPMSKQGTTSDPDLFNVMTDEQRSGSAKAAEDAKTAAEAQAAALKGIQDQIDAFTRLRADHRLLVDDEIEQLSKLHDQAMAVSDRVLREKELLIIRRELRSLNDTQDSFLPAALTRTPSFKSELMTPQFMQGAGIQQGTGQPDLGAFENFGKDAMKSLTASTKEATARVEELVASFNMSGEVSAQFARLVKIHQAQIADAYSESTAAGDSYVKELDREAKHKAANKKLQQAAEDALSQGVSNFFMETLSNFRNLGGAIKNLVLGVIAQIAAAAATSFVLKALGIPGHQAGGTIMGLQSGGSLSFAGGGSFPSQVSAFSGVVRSGTRGVDATLAKLGARETIVSHDMTDRWDRTLSGVANFLARTASTLTGLDQVQPLTLNFHMYGAGGGSDRASLRKQIQEEVVPLILRYTQRGAYRRGG